MSNIVQDDLQRMVTDHEHRLRKLEERQDRLSEKVKAANGPLPVVVVNSGPVPVQIKTPLEVRMAAEKAAAEEKAGQ